MFDNFNKTKLEELRCENELFYNLAVNILNARDALVTPLTVKQFMAEFESLVQDENLKEIVESINREERAYVMLQTGDVSQEDYDRLIEVGIIKGNYAEKMKNSETKTFARKGEIRSPKLFVEDKCMEERLAICVKKGIYSLIEVQKMIDNGLVNAELLDKYYEMHGLKKKPSSSLSTAFKPIMSFDGVKLSNDVVIGGVDSVNGIIDDSPEMVDELANRKIYIF